MLWSRDQMSVFLFFFQIYFYIINSHRLTDYHVQSNKTLARHIYVRPIFTYDWVLGVQNTAISELTVIVYFKFIEKFLTSIAVVTC